MGLWTYLVAIVYKRPSMNMLLIGCEHIVRVVGSSLSGAWFGSNVVFFMLVSEKFVCSVSRSSISSIIDDAHTSLPSTVAFCITGRVASMI